MALILVARAALMKYHKSGALNTTEICLTTLDARSLKSRHQQGWFLQKDVFYASLLISGGLLVIFGIPWLWQNSSNLYMAQFPLFIRIPVKLDSLTPV